MRFYCIFALIIAGSIHAADAPAPDPVVQDYIDRWAQMGIIIPAGATSVAQVNDIGQQMVRERTRREQVQRRIAEYAAKGIMIDGSPTTVGEVDRAASVIVQQNMERERARIREEQAAAMRQEQPERGDAQRRQVEQGGVHVPSHPPAANPYRAAAPAQKPPFDYFGVFVGVAIAGLIVFGIWFLFWPWLTARKRNPAMAPAVGACVGVALMLGFISPFIPLAMFGALVAWSVGWILAHLPPRPD